MLLTDVLPSEERLALSLLLRVVCDRASVQLCVALFAHRTKGYRQYRAHWDQMEEKERTLTLSLKLSSFPVSASTPRGTPSAGRGSKKS